VAPCRRLGPCRFSPVEQSEILVRKDRKVDHGSDDNRPFCLGRSAVLHSQGRCAADLQARSGNAHRRATLWAKVGASIAPDTCQPCGWCSCRHNRGRCVSGASGSGTGADCLVGSRRPKLIVAGQAGSGHRAQCSFSRAGGKHLKCKPCGHPGQETRNKATRREPATWPPGARPIANCSAYLRRRRCSGPWPLMSTLPLSPHQRTFDLTPSTASTTCALTRPA
jgi:hypothetical protein